MLPQDKTSFLKFYSKKNDEHFALFLSTKCLSKEEEESAGIGLFQAGCSVSLKTKRAARVKTNFSCETNSMLSVFKKINEFA